MNNYSAAVAATGYVLRAFSKDTQLIRIGDRLRQFDKAYDKKKVGKWEILPILLDWEAMEPNSQLLDMLVVKYWEAER